MATPAERNEVSVPIAGSDRLYRFAGLVYAVLSFREHSLFHLTEEAFSLTGQFRMTLQRLLEFSVGF